MANILDNRKRIWDDLMGQLKDTGTGTTGGSSGVVSSALQIIDTGGGNSIKGYMYVSVGTAYLGSPSITNAMYIFKLQGSNDSSFGTPIVNLAQIEVGAAHATDAQFGLTPLSGTRNVADTVSSRRVMKAPFESSFMGTVYRYLRVWAQLRTISAGTIATTFHYSAWLTF